MEIKTKHGKFKTFTELYAFMDSSNLAEVKVTMIYPEETKTVGSMSLGTILSFALVEQVKSLDHDLQTLAKAHNVALETVRELAETYSEMNYFDDEDGELQSRLDATNASDELKQEVAQLVNEQLAPNTEDEE